MCVLGASLVAQIIKNLPAMWETWVRSLGQEDPLVKGMATHSSILAWRSPWTEKPGRLQSRGSQRFGHDWATFTLTLARFFTSVLCLQTSNGLSSPEWSGSLLHSVSNPFPSPHLSSYISYTDIVAIPQTSKGCSCLSASGLAVPFHGKFFSQINTQYVSLLLCSQVLA